jgi:Tol biopolymer transport system component
MSLAPGTRIGPYQIVAPLGAGGMGEVYRARDNRLGRDVAIKVLPDIFTRDHDRLERFEREARLLAALSHPHVAAIYGMEEAGDIRALVLELIEGPTLAERIAATNGLPVNEVIDTARQLIDALDAAHERGIVHRDLKPANIKLTHDGQVKVLDFGLAKALEPGSDSRHPASDLSHSPTVTAGGTREGIILGTAAYMSPEQARGTPLDKRTDIWSFGCVLYEMLTGRLAFGGASVSDSIAAILTKDPDWDALPANTPRRIRRLLTRCLEKDQKKRLRDIGDARVEIDDAQTGATSSSESAAQENGRRAARPSLGIAVVAAAVVIAGAILGYGYFRSPAPDPLASVTIERVTADSGLSWMPALSPDGKLIVYASNRAGRGDFDLWVQQTVGGTPLRLTDDPADDWMPSFSPDGSQIAFRSERGGGGVYIVPALGGDARLVAPDGRWPHFSPDGSQLAYWTGQWRGMPSALTSAVFVLPLSGSSPRQVLADFAMARDPLWAADGSALLVLARRHRTQPADTFDWWWVPLDGRPPAKTGLLDMMDLRAKIDREVGTSSAWAASGIVLGAGNSVWRVPVSASGRVTGSPQRLALGAGRMIQPTASQDGQIAFAVTEEPRVVERIGLDTSARPQTLYSDLGNPAGRPSENADGSIIVFERALLRSHEIWLRKPASGEQRMVLRVDAPSGLNSVISPDGRRIAYTVGANDNDQGLGFVVDATGGVPTKICEGCGLHGFLSDNRRILAVDDNNLSVQVVDVITGASQDLVRLSQGEIDRPHVSPDDQWLAFRQVEATVARTYVVPLTPGNPPAPSTWQRVEVSTTTGRPTGWAPDSRTLYLLLDTDGFRCVWGQRIDQSSGRLIGPVFAVRHLHDLNGLVSTSMGNPFTKDGFLYGSNRMTGNIWRVVPGKPGT